MKILIFISTCLIISLGSSGQLLEKKIVNSLDSFSMGYPQEKVFLQLSKNFFFAGEPIWFKAFVLADNKPTILSKVLYVELLNGKDQMVEKKMLPLKEGMADGQFFIKDSLKTGTYSINAYTLWMLNFPDYIYSKNVFISDKDFGNRTPVKPDIQVSFFPEGGGLVTGIKSRVAFRCTGNNGLPYEITGTIKDSHNKEIAAIKSEHDGMGSFEFTPAADEHYTAFVTSASISKQFSLPIAANEGITLQVSDGASKIFARVERSANNSSLYNELYLAAQINNQVVYLNKLNIDEGLDAAAIPKKDLPDGILQIVIFNSNGKKLSERLMFIKKSIFNQSPELKIDKRLRKLNEIIPDLSSYTSPSLSASVLRRYEPDDENIISATLLTSDLPDYIHKPSYYFIDTSAAAIKALDILMITQHWTRFNWEKIMNNEFPVLKYIVESGISVSGTAVRAVASKVSAGQGKVNLWIKGEDSTSIISEARVDIKNRFYIPDLYFMKSADIYYQGTSLAKESSLMNVKINPGYFDTLKTGHRRFSINLDPIDRLQNSEPEIAKLIAESERVNPRTFKLSEVVIKGRKRNVVDSVNQLYVSDIYMNSDQTLIMDDHPYFDIFQYLRRMVPGIEITDSDSGVRVTFSRYAGIDVFSEAGGSSVQFFLNEIPVSVDIISSINPSDVGIIKIYKGATASILGADRGAIAIYTIKGRPLRDWRSRGLDSFVKLGFSPVVKPFNMDYSKINSDSIPKDSRFGLLWEPNVLVKDKKAVIRFYTDDLKMYLKMIVQGIDKNGKLYFFEKALDAPR